MITFNRPYMTGKELWYISQAHHRGQLAGDGDFTKRCHQWIEQQTGCCRALLTHSCTAALEMAALLAGVGEGDEVIMPSYTFVSTANAFVLRGAVPVFVDVRPDTFNLDAGLVEAAITARTRAIVPVHYAGIGCDMQELLSIAAKRDLLVIEDAAQGLMASRGGQALGSFGQLGAISFHETKNVISGEGGALLINDPQLVERAEILREKGTNRSQFFRGEVDKYTWVDVGSSYLPGELIAAFLLAQLEEAEAITKRRLAVWQDYHQRFAALEGRGLVRRPVVPADCRHNAHMYYLLVENLEVRSRLIAHLKQHGVQAVFHYVPLHSSPAGRRFGRAHGDLPVTSAAGERLLRLPLFPELDDVAKIVDLVTQFFQANGRVNA